MRAQRETNSEQLQERLATGARIQELQLQGDRLHFKKMSGEGPDTGWISIKISGKVLAEPMPAEMLSPPQTGSASSSRPRVLCLHGTAGGETIMKRQLAKLFSQAEGQVDLVVLEGTKKCSIEEAVTTMSQFFPGCPMMMYDEVFFDERGWRSYRDVRATLSWFQEQLAQKGPFDAVLGFSQGANFSVMLAAQASAGLGHPLSCVVPICPNAPGYCKQVPELFQASIRIPALVVRGAKEGYDEGMKQQLAAAGITIDTEGEEIVSNHVVKLFETVEVYTHGEGHRPLPGNTADSEAMIDKVMSFLLRHCKP